MKHVLLPLFLLLTSCMSQRTGIRIAAPEKVDVCDLTATLQFVTEGAISEAEYSGSLITEHGYVPFTLSFTSKGNGTLSLPGIEIHCYDAHDNGSLYPSPHWAVIRQVDMNADTHPDLVVDYTILHTGEKEGDATHTTLHHEEFLYCPEESIFKPR